MKRHVAIAALSVGMLAMGAGPALAGNADGNGAQKAALGPQSGSSNDQCRKGSSSGNGFMILNKTGNPEATSAAVYQGEIHLINATPNTTYTVNLVANDGNDHCMMIGMVTTKDNGMGNTHIPVPKRQSITSGSYYIVLQANMQEVFASPPVTVE